MALTLRQKQSRFVYLVGQLIIHATDLGYELTFGEAYRSPIEAARLAKLGLGIINTLHAQRLAIDLNLFKDGVYLDQTPDYLALGEWWEAQSTPIYTCTWGGRFWRADGNHFSLAHEGRK